jgi:hypothetical protein
MFSTKPRHLPYTRTCTVRSLCGVHEVNTYSEGMPGCRVVSLRELTRLFYGGSGSTLKLLREFNDGSYLIY